jgi:hypothetical protein
MRKWVIEDNHKLHYDWCTFYVVTM